MDSQLLRDYIEWILSALALIVALGALVLALRTRREARRDARRRAEAQQIAVVARAADTQPRRPVAEFRDHSGATLDAVVKWAQGGFMTQHDQIRALGEELQQLRSELRARDQRPGASGQPTGSSDRPTTFVPQPGDPRSHSEALHLDPQYLDESSSGVGPTDSPSQEPSPEGQPVEIRGGVIVPSRSLAAMGYLVPADGGGAALLYLNDSVEIDHLSQNRWAQYFDFGGGEPYRRYRTVEPSRIDWNPATEQGRMIELGRVEAV